jgi:putative NADH-flavin reductase
MHTYIDEGVTIRFGTIMKTVAIIGNSGTNARPWTEAFLAAGWRVRSLVRAPQKIVQRPNLTAVAFDFDDAQSHAAALDSSTSWH